MTVTSRDITPDEHRGNGADPGRLVGPPPAESPRIGFLSGRRAEGCFVWLLRLAGVLLVIVSIVGTFYAFQRRATAPPDQIIGDMTEHWFWFVLAVLAQVFLSVGQWGARQRAAGGRRRRGGQPAFWLVYLGLLGASAGLNWIAYGEHLISWGVPWMLAMLAVIGGDAAAELVIVYD